MSLTCFFSVELPGIEPDAEIALSCIDIAWGGGKLRETTRRDLGLYREVLMASTSPFWGVGPGCPCDE